MPDHPDNQPPVRRPVALIVFAVVLLLSLPVWLYRPHSDPPPTSAGPAAPIAEQTPLLPAADRVDERQCQACHGGQASAWATSPHHSTLKTESSPPATCQSCHGPASRHLQWSAAEHPNKRQPDKGFGTALGEADATTQVETCARCHALSTPLGADYRPGSRLLDNALPALLTAELYQVDGKIKAPVHEFGSFTQSSMFAKGVTCTDCHNAHSTELKAPGDGVCLQCHTPGKTMRPGIDGKGMTSIRYDTPAHTHHASGKPGSQCVDCHMPALNVNGELRHDHSLSSPNPVQAAKHNSSDACTSCHANTSSEVAEQFKRWYGSNPPRDGGYADAVFAARRGLPGAARQLLQQLARTDLPAIRRATLLQELTHYPSQRALDQVISNLGNPAPQVRGAAVDAVASLGTGDQLLQLLSPHLSDPVRAVRSAAAVQLAKLPERQRHAIEPLWQPAIAEYEAGQEQLADSAQANLALAELYQRTGRGQQAEALLRAAVQRDANYLPAKTELAQWLDSHGQHAEAVQLLNQAISQHPQSSLLHHHLGLILLHAGDTEKALQALGSAAQLAPDDPVFAYTYAIVLHDQGKAEDARNQLEALLKRQPANRPARLALIRYWHEAGQPQNEQVLQAELEQQNPDDPELQAPNR